VTLLPAADEVNYQREAASRSQRTYCHVKSKHTNHPVTQWRHWAGVTRGGNWRCHHIFPWKKL